MQWTSSSIRWHQPAKVSRDTGDHSSGDPGPSAFIFPEVVLCKREIQRHFKRFFQIYYLLTYKKKSWIKICSLKSLWMKLIWISSLPWSADLGFKCCRQLLCFWDLWHFDFWVIVKHCQMYMLIVLLVLFCNKEKWKIEKYVRYSIFSSMNCFCRNI